LQSQMTPLDSLSTSYDELKHFTSDPKFLEGNKMSVKVLQT